jgi:hypothetical protein
MHGQYQEEKQRSLCKSCVCVRARVRARKHLLEDCLQIEAMSDRTKKLKYKYEWKLK